MKKCGKDRKGISFLGEMSQINSSAAFVQFIKIKVCRIHYFPFPGDA